MPKRVNTPLHTVMNLKWGPGCWTKNPGLRAEWVVQARVWLLSIYQPAAPSDQSSRAELGFEFLWFPFSRIPWVDGIRLNHSETMVETIACW